MRSLARRRLAELKTDATSINGATRFENTLSSLRRVRYGVQPLRMASEAASASSTQTAAKFFTVTDLELTCEMSGPWMCLYPELEEAEAATVVSKPRRRRWRLDKSIWATRKNTSNSSDYFETAEAMRKTFELDWEYARAAHGLEGFIKKVQAEVLDARERETLTGSLSAAEERAAAAAATPDDAAAADRDAILEAEVVEAREVVWSNHLLVYAAFDYYAVTYGSAMDASAEYDIQSLSFNGFLAFARDAKFCSKFCPVRLLEIIFTAVNVDDERVQERLSRVSQKRDELNQKHRLNRHEFVEALVRTAIVRYVQSNEINDVSEAVDKCCRDMRRYLPRECTQSSDVFRSRFCYCELTDAALRKHEATLRNLYERYADINQSKADKTSHRKLLSCGEWMALVEHLGFVRSGNLSSLEAKLIFSWSRIRSVTSYSQYSQTRLRNLQWEDFLEAIVRLSLMIALPTDAEIEAVGAQDAGDYLLALRASQHEMRTFIEARKRPWYKEPTQQAGRCVDHLLSLVTRIVELNTRGAKDLVVSRDEANAFARRGAQAIIVHSVESQREEGEFQRALSLVAERLLHTLSQVPLFGGLTQGQLVMLRGSMSEQINEEDDLVITQGDVGDCFFVIIEGSAEAVLERPPTKKGAEPEEELLKTFGQFDFFGERALLKSEPRFCSVRVTSKQLRTFTITQLTFEETMGKSLSQLLPDYY